VTDTIFKYALEQPFVKLDLPVYPDMRFHSQRARVLSAGVQDMGIVIWVRHADPNETAHTKPIYIFSFNTGTRFHEPRARRFVGTVSVEGIVWHVFTNEEP
jgi:hypothetical protein